MEKIHFDAQQVSNEDDPRNLEPGGSHWLRSEHDALEDGQHPSLGDVGDLPAIEALGPLVERELVEDGGVEEVGLAQVRVRVEGDGTGQSPLERRPAEFWKGTEGVKNQKKGEEEKGFRHKVGRKSWGKFCAAEEGGGKREHHHSGRHGCESGRSRVDAFRPAGKQGTQLQQSEMTPLNLKLLQRSEKGRAKESKKRKSQKQ